MTDRIDQLLATKDQFDQALLADLDDSDRADAAGRAVDPNDANWLRALGILAASDPSPGGMFAQAAGQLLNAGQLYSFDNAAVIGSTVVLGADAVPLIQPAAGSPDPVIAVSAWRTLQCVAPGDALSDLQQSAPQPGTAAGDQAAFALSVIAYRAGTSGLELPVIDDSHVRTISPDADTLSIGTAAPTDDDFNLLMSCRSGELFGLAPAVSASVAIDCGEDHMLACLDPTIQAGIPATLLDAPALAGIIALLDPLGTGYSTRWIALTWPDGAGGINLGLYQPDGAPIYQGIAASADVSDTDATFVLTALDAPGVAPVSVNVVASADGISFTGDQISSAIVGADRLDPDSDD